MLDILQFLSSLLSLPIRWKKRWIISPLDLRQYQTLQEEPLQLYQPAREVTLLEIMESQEKHFKKVQP
jgi:hypothetical protein